MFPTNNTLLTEAIVKSGWETDHRSRTDLEKPGEAQRKDCCEVECEVGCHISHPVSVFKWAGQVSMTGRDLTLPVSPACRLLTALPWASLRRSGGFFCLWRMSLTTKECCSCICICVKLKCSFLISVTKVLDWGNFLQERMCKVYPFLSRPTQVNINLIVLMICQKMVLIQDFMILSRNTSWFV